MIFIPPMEIATRIMTLIDNAKTELILVSPYISIDKWDKFKKCLQRAIDRGVVITIYARENAEQNLETIRSLNLELILVRDLHAKIYLNESYAIASSQNLVQYSDSNSIDFAYSTEIDDEREQLVNFINQYLVVKKANTVVLTKQPVEIETIEKAKEEIVAYSSSQIRQIYEVLHNKFENIRMDGNESYVYCTKLFPFGDAMFKYDFEVRFNFKHNNIESIIKILDDIDLKNNHYQYKREFKFYNQRSSIFRFVPQNVTDFKKLIYDYVFMINKINESTKHLNDRNAIARSF
jgi:hypothetical protein